MCFSRRQAVDGINSEDEEGRDASTVDLNTVVQSRTKPNDSSDTQENFEHEPMDTKLLSDQPNCKGLSLPSPTMQKLDPYVNQRPS